MNLQIILEVVALVEIDQHLSRTVDRGKYRARRRREDLGRPQHHGFRAAGAADAEAHDVTPGLLVNDVGRMKRPVPLAFGLLQPVAIPLRVGIAEQGNIILRKIVGLRGLRQNVRDCGKRRVNVEGGDREHDPKHRVLDRDVAEEHRSDQQQRIGDRTTRQRRQLSHQGSLKLAPGIVVCRDLRGKFDAREATVRETRRKDARKPSGPKRGRGDEMAMEALVSGASRRDVISHVHGRGGTAPHSAIVIPRWSEGSRPGSSTFRVRC